MIKGVFYLEAQGNHRDIVKNSLKALVEKLKREENVEIVKEFFDKIIEEDGNFSSVAEVEAVFKDFRTYVFAAIKYGPSAIEITGPEKLVLSSKEFVGIIGELIASTKGFYKRHDIHLQFAKSTGFNEGVGLSEEEIESFLDQGAIRAKIVIETKGKNRRRAKKDFLNAISEDLFVNKIKSKKLGKGEGFSGLIGIDAFMYEPKVLVDIAAKYTPVLVEIIEPDEIVLKMLDIQDIGVDLASIFFDITHKIAYGPR